MARGAVETKRSIESYLYKRSWTENLIRAGQLRCVFSVCDRDELRSQTLAAFQNVFGADAVEVYEEPDGRNHIRNARIHIATNQTLDVDTEDGTANFLIKHYSPDCFSHIMVLAGKRAHKALEEQPEAINKLPAAILRKAFNGELSRSAYNDSLQ